MSVFFATIFTNILFSGSLGFNNSSAVVVSIIYLVITQALPILVYLLTGIFLIVGIIVNIPMEQIRGAFLVCFICIVIYLLSFLGMFLIFQVIDIKSFKMQAQFDNQTPAQAQKQAQEFLDALAKEVERQKEVEKQKKN